MSAREQADAARFPATHGTDSGPECFRCKGTIWGYKRAKHDGYWTASCVGCGVVEGAFYVISSEPSARLLRITHTNFQGTT